MKKTKWFTGVEPVHVGVYQRRYAWGINYAYFDGVDWGLASLTVEEAYQWGTSDARTFGDRPWRGLVNQRGDA